MLGVWRLKQYHMLRFLMERHEQAMNSGVNGKIPVTGPQEEVALEQVLRLPKKQNFDEKETTLHHCVMEDIVN